MDSMLNVKSSQSSGSPSQTSQFIRAPPSHDSDSEITEKSYYDSNTSVTSATSSTSTSNGGGGFVSGDEDFDTASEMPFVGDSAVEALNNASEEGEEVDVTFHEPYDSPGYSFMPDILMPTAVPSLGDDEEEDNIVNSPKSTALGEYLLGESSAIEKFNSGVGSEDVYEVEAPGEEKNDFLRETNSNMDANFSEENSAPAEDAKILNHCDAESLKLDVGVVTFEDTQDSVLESQELEAILLKDGVVVDDQKDHPSDRISTTESSPVGDLNIGSNALIIHPEIIQKDDVDKGESFEAPNVENISVDNGRGSSGHDSDEPVIYNDESSVPKFVINGKLAFTNESDHLTEDESNNNYYEDEKDVRDDIFGGSETAKHFLEELESGKGNNSISIDEGLVDHGDERVEDGQIVLDSDEEEVDTDGEEGDGKEIFDSDALNALLKAAANAGLDGGAGGGNVTVTSQDGSRLFSLDRPAGLGSSLRSLRPTSTRSNLFTPSNIAPGSDDNLSEEENEKLEKLQQIRIKFLRLVHRLGYSIDDHMVQQVLYRITLIAGRQNSPSFKIDDAKRIASELEAGGKALDFSLNILVLGKTGVGKSATINSIMGEERAHINAFESTTTEVKEITGIVDGVKIRVFDTPGLRSSAMEQGHNRKALSSIQKCIKSSPPDIMLYLDRLDSQTRDLNDLPLLKSITTSLGLSMWRSAIVTLTHASSAPPDGPTGSPMSYDNFVAQRSHVVQQSIGQAVGDLRVMNPSLMNPVSLAENHHLCRKNRDGQKVLPNGITWRAQLLLLCYSMKILSDANLLSKSQDLFDHRKLFGFRARSPHLPYLLSWLLQSRPHPKLQSENADPDADLVEEFSDSEIQEGEEDEYDQLPPFKPLKKDQIAKLSKGHRKAYLEEYDYRVKLFQKKQWKEELKRMKESKKGGKVDDDHASYLGEEENNGGGPVAVPVPLPDMILPPSFDSDSPSYRYRFLEPTSQFLARPVLDNNGWDHDCGYDGVNIEQTLAVMGRFPAMVTAQIAKDKNEFTLHLDSAISAKHGETGSTMAGFDIQNIGKQLAYIIKGETRLKKWRKNRALAGTTITFLGENVAPGVKFEDQISIGKRVVLVGSAGAVRSQGDAAYGANMEVRLREADFPIGQDQSTLGVSLVKWRGDLAIGANLVSQFSVGRGSKMAIRVAVNNKLSGQITVKTSSSEMFQIGILGILPVAMAIYKNIWPAVGENYSIY